MANSVEYIAGRRGTSFIVPLTTADVLTSGPLILQTRRPGLDQYASQLSTDSTSVPNTQTEHGGPTVNSLTFSPMKQKILEQGPLLRKDSTEWS